MLLTLNSTWLDQRRTKARKDSLRKSAQGSALSSKLASSTPLDTFNRREDSTPGGRILLKLALETLAGESTTYSRARHFYLLLKTPASILMSWAQTTAQSQLNSCI